MSPGNDFTYVSSDKIGLRVDEIDAENFNCIMKMHPHFPELIAAFKEEPDAYDSFIATIQFYYYLIFIDYMHIYSYFPFIFQLVCTMGDARSQDTSSSICFSTNLCGSLPKT